MEGLLPLGSPAPDFSLPDVVSGKAVSLQDFAGKKALMVLFICRHCPYVQHVKKALAQLGKDYRDKDAAIVAISANDPEKVPQDAPESLAAMAKEEGFAFPFLFDGPQKTAQAYTAVATPDVYIFDGDRKLVYRGQFDDSRPFGFGKATGKDVREALDAVLEGRRVSSDQKPAVGCSIKWKPGNEPAYLS
ncbi:MAG: thioredoxin family protein [Candidatus Omnitrophota bacterium]